ncbi:MAG: carboxy-S-adenosyl-L-methionine synthase CmoA [Fuerstiella sp.]
MAKDNIYEAPLNQVGDFEFDDAVADVFPDMIRRSVPGYSSMLSMVAQCARQYSQPQTEIWDLGCSLGACTMLMHEQAASDCQIVAVDLSSSMLKRLQATIERRQIPSARIALHEADIRDVAVQNASFVCLNLTLQFLPQNERTAVLKSVSEGMNSGAALLLSEKVSFEDADQQKLMTNLHHDFKRAHGYSDLEISQKRTAIENRLVPETLQQHTQRLKQVGFGTVSVWFQCFNFASILAIKP